MGNIRLSIGYDTERPYKEQADTPAVVEFRKRQVAFVRKISTLLDSESVPRTHFILGKYLSRCLATFSVHEIRDVYPNDNPLMEIQQHSYSHQIIRPTQEGDKQPISIKDFISDVRLANRTLSEILQVSPTGLRFPRGYSRDLSDLPELLDSLEKAGIKYVSSMLRFNENLIGLARNREIEIITYGDVAELVLTNN